MSLYDYNGNPIGESVKAVRPTEGAEHFTVKINKADLSVNTGTTGIQDSMTEYTDSGVIFIPESYTVDGTPTRLIISCHGSGTVIDDSFGITTKTWNNFLYQMGYAIMDVNGGTDDSRHFGAPFAIQSYIKAYQYVVDKYNLYPEVFVLGGSMGGLPAFTLAQCGAVPVKALAGFCPVVDLLRQAWMNPWYGGSSGEAWGTQRKLIAEYFNFDDYDTFSGWTNTKTPSETEMQYFLDNADKWQGYNPMTCGAVNGDSILTTATSDYADLYGSLIKTHKVPIKIWQSDADPTVSAEFGKYIVSAIKKSGGIAYHRSYPSGGHTPGWGDTISVQSLQGVTLAPYTNEYECYLWFKRWE